MIGDRSIADVVGQILQKMPVAEQAEFRNELDDLARRFCYVAPELAGAMWVELGKLLTDRLPFPPQEEWQWEVGAVLANVPVEEFKARVAGLVWGQQIVVVGVDLPPAPARVEISDEVAAMIRRTVKE